MSDTDDSVALRDYLRRDSVSAANWSCTLAIGNLLILPVGLVSAAVLMLTLCIGFFAWRLGIRAGRIQNQFRLGCNYSKTASIGKWLGGLEFLTACVFCIALLLLSESSVAN